MFDSWGRLREKLGRKTRQRKNRAYKRRHPLRTETLEERWMMAADVWTYRDDGPMIAFEAEYRAPIDQNDYTTPRRIEAAAEPGIRDATGGIDDGPAVSLVPETAQRVIDQNQYVTPRPTETMPARETHGATGGSGGVNFPPTAEDDPYYYMYHDDVLRIFGSYGGVLANDTDPEGDPLTATLVSGPTHGTLDVDGDGAPDFNADGTFAYKPDHHFVGTDTFVYQISDGVNFDTATASIDVVNFAPAAQDDFYYMYHDDVLRIFGSYGGVLANDSDANYDPLTVSLVSGPAHGSLIPDASGAYINADGTFTYKPDHHFAGPDSFVYRVSDGIDSVTATAFIDVVNFAPMAQDDTYYTVHDHALDQTSNGVLANDSDANYDPLAASLVTGPAHGTLDADGDGAPDLNADGTFVYTPDPGYFGDDEFTYQVGDGIAYGNVATVKIHVTDQAPGIESTPAPLFHWAPGPNNTEVVSLWDIFQDPDDADDKLTFTVAGGGAGVTTSVDNLTGELTLMFTGAPEEATIYVTATDACGKSASSNFPVHMVDGSVSVAPDFSGDLAIDDSNLIMLTTDGVGIYAPQIPFVVTGHLSDNAPSSFWLHVVVTNDAGTPAVFYDYQVAPGEVYSRPILVEPGLAGNVTVEAKLQSQSPLPVNAFVEDSEDEPIISLQFGFNDFTGNLELTPGDVKSWAASGGETLAGTLLNNKYTAEEITNIAEQLYDADPLGGSVADYEQVVHDRVNVIKSQIASQFKILSDAAIGQLLEVLRPRVDIRLGQHNPARPDLQQFITGIPSAINAGMDAQIPENETLLENIDEFFVVDRVSAGSLLQQTGADQLYTGTLEYVKTGDASKLPDMGTFFEDIGWKDLVIIQHAGLQVPLDFTVGDATFDAYLNVGVDNVSLVDIQSIEYAAGVSLAQPVDIGIRTINIFNLQGSERRNLNTGQKEDDLLFQFQIIQ